MSPPARAYAKICLLYYIPIIATKIPAAGSTKCRQRGHFFVCGKRALSPFFVGMHQDTFCPYFFITAAYFSGYFRNAADT